jgi:hypothetical protein
MSEADILPTFHTLRLRHALSLEAIYEQSERSIDIDEIRLFDETGRANPYTADDLLFILSELSGHHYDRTNVGGITFVLARPPALPINPPPRAALSSEPTLFELYVAYGLDVNWLGEAIGLNDREVWDLIMERAGGRNQPAMEQLFRVISQYTGVTYRREMAKSG